MIRNYKIKLPADWEVVRLGKVFDIDWGNTNLTKNIYKPEGYPVFSAMGQDGFTDFYEHDGEAIILSAIGARAGKCFFASGKWTAIKNTIVIKVKESRDVDIRFVFYYVNDESYWRRSGSGQPFVTLGMARQQAIPLPPFPEQQKIVYVLDTIQEAIGVQEKLIEKTKELKRAMMAKLFREGTRGEKLKKTEIGEIPESWEVVRLGDENLFEIKLGGTPKTSVSEYWNGEIPWITPNDLSNLSTPYINVTERTISQTGLESGSILMPGGSIILSTRAPIGYVAILGKPMAFNQGCKGVLILKKDRVDNVFLYYFLITRKEQLHELGFGSTFRELSTYDMEDLPIPLPPLQEQLEIASILQTIDQKLEIEQKKKVLYEGLFRVMMAKLMTGEIRVKDIEFE